MDPMLARLWRAQHLRRGAGLRHLERAARAGTVTGADLGGGPRGTRALASMARRGYVERSGGQRPFRYRVTLRGRCRLACCSLRLPFLSLCLLAEARAMHAMQDECGAAREYHLCLLEEAFEGLYTAKTVRNAASELRSAGFSLPARRGAIRLRGVGLRGFGPVLDELHWWIAGVRDRVSMAAMGDRRAVAALRGRPC